jgi:hypothetical protein
MYMYVEGGQRSDGFSKYPPRSYIHSFIQTHAHTQAQQYLTFLSENAPRALDVSSQLDLVERLLVTLRSATDGGLMPGADGQKVGVCVCVCVCLYAGGVVCW